ncbi:leucyl aminopeptidase [Marinibaculum pumilum]|uniref:Leucyl aminopeptidase n=1 Tax=Marinibaculum pumilum TaxID=1766165 RepID=A0ABV7KUZ0_9PROT
MEPVTDHAGLVKLFTDNYRLCEIGPGQTVAVLSEGGQLRDYAEASLAAVRALGAEAVDVNVPSDTAMDASQRIANIGQNPLSQHPAAMQACKDADMVIDHMLLLFSREQIEMQKAGSRILMVVEPVEVLQRLFPTKALRARVEAGERLLADASSLRFVNRAGTDVTYRLAGKSILTEYGYTVTPGRWDHWPGGFLATLAADGGVEGRVVMDRGDLLFPQKRALTEPVEFVIRDGWVREINGGREAAELRAFIEGYDDPRAYALSHIGWGLNDACVWDPDLPGIGMDGRAHYGNVLFSMGPDTEFGGDNDTPCHLDLPMRNCTLWLDDRLIVEDGEVVPAEMKPAA